MGLIRALWKRYHYFFWVWLVLTAIVLIGYETQFDRERICTYQYCPSSFVLAVCTSSLVLGMVWVEFFFGVLRPLLQLRVGRILGTKVVLDSERPASIFELIIGGVEKDLWEAAPGASIVQQILVTVLDFLSFILFVMLPITGIISLSVWVAHIEQKNSPIPKGLIGITKQ